jgi:DNA polymerase V
VRHDCPSDRFEDLLGAAGEALRRAYVPDAVATHMHVIALDFCRAHGCQTSLFDAPYPKRDAVAAVEAAVNNRYGRFTVRSGIPVLIGEVI